MRPPLSRLRQLLRRPPPVEVWYDEAYRIPLPSLESAAGVEPRRVDFVVWYLLESRAIRPAELRTPEPVSWEDLQRVHDPGWLESLQSPEVLASIFAVDPSELPVEPVLSFIRLAAGGTVAAARSVLRTGGTALNLAGGFHHAGPGRGGGFCAVNDIACAIARVRAEGFAGQVVVLDLDAHPPDGLSECLAADPAAWIGSLTASRWSVQGPVEEIVLAEGTGDEGYLAALDQLLGRMPPPALAFVISGGDVLAGDRLGRLSLTLAGARARDRRVFNALGGVPQVWLPGGGYHPDAWRVLAGTGLVLARRGRRRIPRAYDPLTRRFSLVARELSPDALHGDWALTEDDLFGDLGHRPPPAPRLLGFYTASGVEYGLFRQGILGQVRRLGYAPLRVEVDSAGTGDRLRLFGQAQGKEHLLIESVMERRRLGGAEVLFVNWLTLRNPGVRFSPERAPLPGQEVPGLGLAREATLVLALIARRLGLEAVVVRPAWYHLARRAGPGFRFLDPERHGRFGALARDTDHLPLAEVSRAVAEGRARINGRPYAWEATDFAYRLIASEPEPAWQARADAEKARVRFELATAG